MVLVLAMVLQLADLQFQRISPIFQDFELRLVVMWVCEHSTEVRLSVVEPILEAGHLRASVLPIGNPDVASGLR